jgi:tetratricopeptide (TPR) repeat protein
MTRARLQIWAVAALCCAATGCTRMTEGSGPPLPPDPGEPDARARAGFMEVAGDYAERRQRGPLGVDDCRTLARRFAGVAKEHRSVADLATFNQAAVLEECGLVDDAIVAYRRAAPAGRGSAKAHNNLGVLLWQRGEHDDALRHFKTAVAIDSHGAEPRNNLATALRPAYIRSADDATFVAAEEALQSALAVRSDDPLAYENLARLYYDRGRLEDRSYLLLADLVITQAERVLEARDEKSAELANLRGLLFMQRGDPIHALRKFSEASSIDPAHAESHMNAAMIAIEFRDYPLAEKSLDQAMKSKRYRKSVDAHLALGVARRGRRDYTGAREALEAAQALDEHDPRALYNLGILYSDHIAPAKDEFDPPSYERAIDYFDRFAARADAKTHAARVKDARTRSKKAAELIEIAKSMRVLEAKAHREEEARRKAEEADRQRRLDLERKALAAERS